MSADLAHLNPSTFWSLYKSQLRNRGSWAAYQSDPAWTKIATAAAIETCKEFGLATDCALRLDVCSYAARSTAPHDWALRVAFEVENTPHWKDELCKLAHIVADLSVLAAYQAHATWSAEEALAEHIFPLADRIRRVPGRQWLFVFGPHVDKPVASWTAYTLDDKLSLVRLTDDAPLRGIDLGERQGNAAR